MTAPRLAPFWLWPNLLSLDAPLVALVWQDFLARCYPSVLLPVGRLVLFLSVWAIYIVDRLIDVRGPEPENETARHRFYRQNGVFAAGLLAVVMLADLLAVSFLPRPAVVTHGLVVGGIAVFYMAIFPLRRIGSMRWKQPAAAAVFTTGVFLIAWTGTTDAWVCLSGPALAFGALCLGNMVLIEHWEHLAQRSGASGPAGALSMWSWLSMMIVVAVCAVTQHSRWYGSVAFDAAGLTVIERLGTGLPRDARSVLADLVLFTPLLLR